MPQTRRAKKAGNSALDRLQTSIDSAETALKDLRREVGRESQARLKDVGTTLTATRRNLTRSRTRIMKDLEQVEHALMKGKAKGKAKAKARVRTTPKKRTRKTSRASATRSTRTTAAKSSAKASSRGAAKARAKRPAKRAAKKSAAR